MKLRAWAGPAAVLTCLALSGCSSLTPGTAAVVGDEKISMKQVDELAAAQCDGAVASAEKGQSAPLSISDVKRRSLSLLIETKVSEQYAESQDAAPTAQVTSLIDSSFTQALQQFPSKSRKVLGDALHDLAASQSALVTVAARNSGETVSTANVESLLNAGVAARREWQKKLHIETDARFNPGKSGYPSSDGNGSVSEPVSGFAKGGVATQAAPAWVDALPATQKCG